MPIKPQVQTLTDGQTQQFELVDAAGAPVAPAGGVTWSVSPTGAGAVSLHGGLYTAPVAINAEVQATVQATLPDGSVEEAAVRLVPLAVVLLPTAVSLREGETQQFDATVPGDPANGVRWNVAPGLGTMVDGLYTAPTPNLEDREVQVTAISVLDPRRSATAKVSLQSKPPRMGVPIGLFVYLVAIFSLVSLLLCLWPSNVGTTADSGPVKTCWGATLSREVDLLLLVLICGALGSFAHGARSFVDFVGNRTLRASWAAWYLLYPLIGATLALIFYLSVRGGFMTTNSGQEVNLYGLTAISGLVGMFSKQATTKLSEVFSTMFKTDKGDTLKNKLN